MPSVPLAQALANLRAKMEEDRGPAPETDGVTCHWCGQACGGTCLPLRDYQGTGPRQMKPSDPAYFMLTDGHRSTPTVHDDTCYICRDPEFAQMGLPLCKPCPKCTAAEGDGVGHIPADDEECSACGFNLHLFYDLGEDMAAYDRETGGATA